MANQLIFSTEQRAIIYDQYLLTQSASQVRRLSDFVFFQQDSATAHTADIQCVCSMTELLVGIYGLLVLLT